MSSIPFFSIGYRLKNDWASCNFRLSESMYAPHTSCHIDRHNVSATTYARRSARLARRRGLCFEFDDRLGETTQSPPSGSDRVCLTQVCKSTDRLISIVMTERSISLMRFPGHGRLRGTPNGM